MVSVEIVETIARPPADVFAFVADMRNEPRWHTDVLEAQPGDGTTVSQGSRFAVKYKPFLGMSDASATVSEYQATSKVVHEIDMGKMRASATCTVEAADDGSRLSRRLDLEGSGLLGMGRTFLLWRNTLSGSYLALTSPSR